MINIISSLDTFLGAPMTSYKHEEYGFENMPMCITQGIDCFGKNKKYKI